MAKQANILSFDEAKRATGTKRPGVAAVPRRSSKRGAGQEAPKAKAPVGSARASAGRAASRASAGRSSSRVPASRPQGRAQATALPKARERGAQALTARTARTVAAPRVSAVGAVDPSRAAARSVGAAPRSARYGTASRQGMQAAPDARSSEARAEAADDSQEVAKPSLADKLRRFRRARAKEKAGKAFSRQFESKQSDASQAGPRAAVYKGEMGQTHKRAARMQASPAGEASRKRTLSERGASLKSSSKFIVSVAVAACIALTCVFLYPVAQQYYQSVREYDRLQAEYAAVEQRNAALSSDVSALSSDAGVESTAREEFGWVRDGEHAVVVQGLEGHDDSDSSFTANIVPGSVEAPETWYSPMLDALFGVE